MGEFARPTGLIIPDDFEGWSLERRSKATASAWAERLTFLVEAMTRMLKETLRRTSSSTKESKE